MKSLLFLGIMTHAFVAAQSLGADPMLVDPSIEKSVLFVERFSAPEISIPVGFLSAPGSLQNVTADAHLDGGDLLAPLARNLPFHPAEPGKIPYLITGNFVISMADISKPAFMRMTICTPAEPNTEKRVIGTVIVRTTPPGDLEALLMSRIEDRAHPLKLIVFGKASGLREMLKNWHVPFNDTGSEPPSSAQPDSLVIGETSDLSHLPNLLNGSSIFAQTTDSGLDTESVIRESGTTRSTIIRYTENSDWRNDPKLHRLLSSHLQTHKLP